MRIIGGKDYYDSAAAYGIDPGIIYVRKEMRLTNGDIDQIGRYVGAGFFIRPDNSEELTFKTKYRWEQGNFEDGLKVQTSSPILIFCGKVYSGVFVTVTEGTGLHKVSTEYRFWKADKFDEFLKDRGWRLATGEYYSERGYTRLKEKFFTFELKDDALKFIMERQIVSVTPKQLSLNLNRPHYRSLEGWHLQDSDYVANSDNLKDWDFQKAFDPVSAFQEISQWVGGTLSSYGPNIVEITDDKIKLAKHGFDHWTFRKQGPKSKL